MRTNTNSTRTHRPRRARRHLAALAALAALSLTGCGAGIEQYPDCVEFAQNRLGCYQERVGDEPAEVKLPLINGNKYQREVAEGELVWESIIPYRVPETR